MATSQDYSDMSQQGEDAIRRAQIKAYVDWMNAQLKKRPGMRRVEDLKCDLQDGVALINLVAIIAGQELPDVHNVPTNSAEMEQNINQVLQFMTERKIKMHYTTAKDIVDGNVKAIMRLILALAAHYKPNSVKQSSRNGSRATTPLAGIAQSAAVALADARHDAAISVHKPQRPVHLTRMDRPETLGYVQERYSQIDGASSSGGSPSGRYGSPRRSTNGGAGSPSRPGPRRLEFSGLPKSRSEDFPPGHESHDRLSYQRESSMDEDDRKSEIFGIIDEEHTRLEVDLQGAKHQLMALQDLLLNGRPPDDESEGASPQEDASPVQASSQAEEIVILQSKLQQSEEIANELRAELSRVRTECMQLQGLKTGLQQRLSEQENSFLVLKAELLRAGFCKQSLENTKNEIEQKLKEKDQMLLELKRKLSEREHETDELQVDCQVQMQEHSDTTRNLKSQIINLHDKIKKVGDTEVNLTARMLTQDKKMAKIEDRIMHGHNQYDSSSGPLSRKSFGSDSEDLQLVRESLRSLRNRFHGDDPQHRTIDALEQSISTLMDRLNVTEEQRWNETSMMRRSDAGRSPLPGASRLDHSSMSNGHGVTKVLYFTDRTVTPFMYTIPKRLGEIKLRDIKCILDRPGKYRYHFKALDPEFGTVKEEITQEDDIIPGWEGKIVAWIEEDHG